MNYGMPPIFGEQKRKEQNELMYQTVLDRMEFVGQLIRTAWEKARTQNLLIPDLENQQKLDVTKYDLLAERLLVEAIRSYPDHPEIYSEEKYTEIPLNAENIWIIDPISGTKLFKNGKDNYAIVVSHMVKGEPVFAAVYNPTKWEMITARKGLGAYIANANPNENKIQSMPKLQVATSNIETLPIYYDYSSQVFDKGGPEDKGLELMGRLAEEANVVKSFGSMAIHYSKVATGEAQVAITLNKDTYPEMAGRLIVEEAGGVCATFTGGKIGLESVGGVIYATNQDILDKYIKICQPFLKFRKIGN
jgi:myo-inositol-1(or 4)-monophosphatase